MSRDDQDTMICYTDGSALRNGKRDCQCSSATVWPNGEFPDTAFYLPPGDTRSNNRAEYHAIICACDQANEHDPSKAKTLCIFPDSMLLVNTCTTWMHSWKKKGWKKSSPGEIKNLDMVKKLYDCCRERKIVFTHVKAHTGGDDFDSLWNKRADKCAYGAVKNDTGAPC
ncbi:unnamed protein product [Ectocarpus fasciculatus]